MDKLLGLEFWMWEPEDQMTGGNDLALPGDKLAPSELSVSVQLWWLRTSSSSTLALFFANTMQLPVTAPCITPPALPHSVIPPTVLDMSRCISLCLTIRQTVD